MAEQEKQEEQVLVVEWPTPEVALVTLNRPRRLNALSGPLVDELHVTLDALDANTACRVVVLTGAGRGFCSGLDLSGVGAAPGGGAGGFSPLAGIRGQERIAELALKLRRLHHPVIAAVNGPAYGGGLALALASDIRVAAPEARFCTQFIKIGLSDCDIGVSYLLPRLVGASRGFELLLTARTVDAAEADRIGLVSAVVPGAELVERALEIADTICGYTAFGVTMTKQVMWENLDAPSMEAAVQLENRTQILATTGGELADAAKAFFAKPKAAGG